MNSEESTDRDSVPFELAKCIWVESGALPVSLSGASFGGTLSLLYEASRIAEALGIPKILFSSCGTQAWFQSLAKKFEYSTHVMRPSYPSDLNEMSMFPSHSTLRLLNYPELFSRQSEESIWSDSVIEETSRFLGSIVSSKAVLFATKFQNGMRRLGDFPHEQWVPILQRLAETHNIFILGSNPTRDPFAKLRVTFLADRISLAAQVELVSSSTLPLIGDASGFFSASIWHRGAYLCFKDPRYDFAEMELEHNGMTALHVGGSSQYLVRDLPSIVWVNRFLKEAKLARKL